MNKQGGQNNERGRWSKTRLAAKNLFGGQFSKRATPVRRKGGHQQLETQIASCFDRMSGRRNYSGYFGMHFWHNQLKPVSSSFYLIVLCFKHPIWILTILMVCCVWILMVSHHWWLFTLKLHFLGRILDNTMSDSHTQESRQFCGGGWEGGVDWDESTFKYWRHVTTQTWEGWGSKVCDG